MKRTQRGTTVLELTIAMGMSWAVVTMSVQFLQGLTAVQGRLEAGSHQIAALASEENALRRARARQQAQAWERPGVR